jgi:RND family efflux transporter MFP subunit
MLAALTAILLLLPACAREKKVSLPAASSSAATPVRVVRPQSKLPAGNGLIMGTIRSCNEAVLGASVTARVRYVGPRVGDRVKAGQALVRLDASHAAIGLRNARATLRLADANVGSATLELERTTALHERGSIADAMLDGANTKREVAAAQQDQAHAAVAMAQQQSADSTIVAPFDGVISARFKNPGDTVTAMPPTPLLQLIDPDHLEARLSVPESLAPLVNLGTELTGIPSPTGPEVRLQVSAIGASIDPSTRTVEVIATVVAPDASLRSGALINVDLSSLALDHGLVVPSLAIRKDPTESFALVLVGDRLIRKPVTYRQLDPETAVVASGLGTSDAVVIDPTLTLREGDTASALPD